MIDNPLNKFDPDSPEAKVCRSQPLGVHTLHASPTNPRKTFDEKAMAKLFGINTAEVRKTLIAEQKSNKSNGKTTGKAKKTAEKAEKSPVLAAAEGSTPRKAARAAEDVGAKNVFKAGDRVRVTNPEDFEGTAQGWRAKVMNAEGVVVNVADGHWVTVRLDGPSQTEEDFTVNELTKRSPSSPHAHWRSASRSPRRSS